MKKIMTIMMVFFLLLTSFTGFQLQPVKAASTLTENLSMAFFRGNSNVNPSLKTVFIKTCIDQARLDELNAKNQY